jgi:hypothetical protein
MSTACQYKSVGQQHSSNTPGGFMMAIVWFAGDILCNAVCVTCMHVQQVNVSGCATCAVVVCYKATFAADFAAY